MAALSRICGRMAVATTCILVASCVTATGPITPQQVAEMQALEVDTAARLAVEGEALYQADTNKQDGYDYCSAATRLAYEGEFRRSIREATKALFLGERTGDTNLLALANRDISLAYSLAGQLDRAAIFVGRAIDLIELSSSSSSYARNRASMLKIRGDIRLRQGHAKQAVEDYKSALSGIAGSLGRRSIEFEIMTSLSLANAYLAVGNLDAAKAIFSESQSKASYEISPLIDRGLANLALLEGRSKEAGRHFASAAERYAREGNHYHLFFALDGLARSRLAAGDGEGAIEAYQRGVVAAEKVRAEFRSEEFKAGFFGDIQEVFERAIQVSMDGGRAAEAVDFSERSRARALQDMVRGRVVAGAGQAFTESYGEPVSHRKIQRAIPPNLAVALFHVLPDRTYVWTIRKTGIASAQIPLGREELRKLVSDYRKWVVGRTQQSSQAGVRLYQRLVEPLKLAGGEELVIVPHDALHYLPFHALSGANGFLIESRPVSYAASASDVVFQLERDRLDFEKVLAFGNPDLGIPSLNLPGSEIEVGNLKSVFQGSKVYVKSDATKARLIGEAPGNSLLHIAAHAEVDKVDPLYSVIRMARTKAGPADIEAHEVYSIDLNKAKLVALSACDTGLGQVSRGDEVWGFTRTFLSAGARSLLVSLWPVADDSTEQLMTGFYKVVSAGKPLAEGLRQAQLDVLRRNETSHPFFWAPFILVGARQ